MAFLMTLATQNCALTDAEPTRLEHDSLGPVDVPADAYYGPHTARAVANFPISGRSTSEIPDLVVALAEVKLAAARANHDLGALAPGKFGAIDQACREIIAGQLHDQFPVDCIQGGAGTSTNMNINEVVANRALEILGHDRGAYDELHYLDDVNRSQSTNDVFPTALKIAIYRAIDPLLGALTQLEEAFAGKGDEFADVLTMSRTQLQDAVPMTLGLVFRGFAAGIAEERAQIDQAAQTLKTINLGGTAIGTEINTPAGYTALVRDHLDAITGIEVRTAPNLLNATSDMGPFVQVSGALKRAALKLSKISNDLRLMSSGPQTGLGDIELPAVQAGSSIMPGKVNPVIPEVVSQVAFVVAGNDLTISMAAEGGQLQLNPFEPVIVTRLHESITQLANAATVLTEKCVRGITTSPERLRHRVHHSVGLATALTPLIGYSAATRLAQEALMNGESLVDLVLRDELASAEELDATLEPDRLVHPHEVGTTSPSTGA